MYYVDAADIRNVHLKELLKQTGEKVEDFSLDKKIEESSICVFSPAKKFSVELVKKFPNNITIFAGNLNKGVVSLLKAKNINYKNLMEDEIFTIKNANLTSEGVLALILEKSDKSIFDNNVLILGGGRIARSLSILLGKLGVTFSVVSFNKIKFPQYYLYSNKCYYNYSFINDLEKYDVIVNTIPAAILDEDITNTIAKNTIFIETASVNCLNSKKATHFNYVLAPGLPKVYSAKTAGKLVYENIMDKNNYKKIGENYDI